MIKKIIYVDVDGTICSQQNSPQDFKDEEQDYTNIVPFSDRIKAINELYDQGHTIVYWTARGCLSGMDHAGLTNAQLLKWGAKYHRLEIGNKPHFDMYICDKSFNSESWFHSKERGLP